MDNQSVADRWRHVKSLDRRMGVAREEPLPNIEWEEFSSKLTSLRKGTVQWGAARVQHLFIQRLHSKFDGIVSVDGSKVHSLSSFTDFVTAGPWDDRMRNIVFYAQDGMWEKCNSWSYNLEAEYARMLGITFTGVKANGSRPKRTHKGKCAHYLFVKCKGTLVNTIRNTTKRVWKEALFHRRPKTPKVPALTVMTENAESANHTRSIPKILHYTSSQAISGFTGVIGICEGHPSLGGHLTLGLGSSAATSSAASSLGLGSSASSTSTSVRTSSSLAASSDTSTLSSTDSPSAGIQEPPGLDLLRELMAKHTGMPIGAVSQLIEAMKLRPCVPGEVVLGNSSNTTSTVETMTEQTVVAEKDAEQTTVETMTEQNVVAEKVAEQTVVADDSTTGTDEVSFFASLSLSYELLITYFLMQDETSRVLLWDDDKEVSFQQSLSL